MVVSPSASVVRPCAVAVVSVGGGLVLVVRLAVSPRRWSLAVGSPGSCWPVAEVGFEGAAAVGSRGLAFGSGLPASGRVLS